MPGLGSTIGSLGSLLDTVLPSQSLWMAVDSTCIHQLKLRQQKHSNLVSKQTFLKVLGSKSGYSLVDMECHDGTLSDV